MDTQDSWSLRLLSGTSLWLSAAHLPEGKHETKVLLLPVLIISSLSASKFFDIGELPFSAGLLYALISINYGKY